MRLVVTIALAFALAVMTGCSNGTNSSDGEPANDLAARRQHIKQQESQMSAEAESRKARSIAILKAEKVPVLEDLPLIETEAESTRRTTEQVATLNWLIGYMDQEWDDISTDT